MKKENLPKEVLDILLLYKGVPYKEWALYEVLAGVILKEKYEKIEVDYTFDYYIPSLNKWIEVKKVNSPLNHLSYNQKLEIYYGTDVLFIVPKLPKNIKKILWHENLLGFDFYLVELDLKGIIDEVKVRKKVEKKLEKAADELLDLIAENKL